VTVPQLPFKPVAGFGGGDLAECAAQQSGEREVRGFGDRGGVVPQVQQNGQTAAVAAALFAYLARGVAQQGGLPASRGADDRQHRRIGVSEEVAEGLAFGDLGRQVGQ